MLNPICLQYPGNDFRYTRYLTDIRFSVSETLIRWIESKSFSLHRKLPKSESLKDCMDRTIPYFTEQIMPEAIGEGKRVLIASSENAIRGLLMYLCEIPQDKIAGLEVSRSDVQTVCTKLFILFVKESVIFTNKLLTLPSCCCL